MTANFSNRSRQSDGSLVISADLKSGPAASRNDRGSTQSARGAHGGGKAGGGVIAGRGRGKGTGSAAARPQLRLANNMIAARRHMAAISATNKAFVRGSICAATAVIKTVCTTAFAR
jgi:hypothetical protein